MKIHLALPCLCCAAFFLFTNQRSLAQSSSSTWTARDQSRDWRAFACSGDGWRVVAAVNGGSVMKSSDGGSTWEATSSGTGAWCEVACSGDGMRIIAAEQSYGSVKLSTDFGATWTQASGLGKGNWEGVASSKDGNVLAVAYSGSTIKVSPDGGATWTDRGESAYWFSLAMADDGKTILAGGMKTSPTKTDLLSISTDSGVTWTNLSSQTGSGERAWSSVAINGDATRIIAGSNRGKVYTGVKSGTSWTWSERLQPGQWSVAMSKDGLKMTAANSGGQIYVSSDGGSNWTATQGDAASWQGVATSEDGNLRVVGVWNGKISSSGTPTGPAPTTTTPPGPTAVSTWRSVATTAAWESLASSDDGSVLIAAGRINRSTSDLYTSTDSGATWSTHQPLSSSTKFWTSVAVNQDGTKAYACQAIGGIVIGTRMGSTWSWQTTSAPGSLGWASITCDKAGTKVAAAASSGYIYVSSNSGTTWTEGKDTLGQSLRGSWISLDCSSDGTSLVAAQSDGVGGLYLSTDSGATWDYSPLYPGSGQRPWRSVSLSADGKTILAGAGTGLVYLGKRSGDIWSWTTHRSSGNWTTACSADGVRLLAADEGKDTFSSGKIHVSTDGGVTWVEQESDRKWRCIATNKDATRSIAGASETNLYMTP